MRIAPVIFKTASAKSRVCTKCGVKKSLDSFAKSKKGKYGRRSQCRDCERFDITKRTMAWKRRNPTKVKTARAKYSGKHREAIRAKGREYARENREEIRRKYREKHPKRIKTKRIQTLSEIEQDKAQKRKWVRGYCRRESAAITDRYIRKRLANKTDLKVGDFPDELVKLKRDQIKLRRGLKNGIA